ncbi:MAG: hypothetical protein QM690_20050 [Sphingobium sp.]
MRTHEKSDSDGQPPISAWCYAFPCAAGGEWTLTVPASLAACVGRYARIPEFACRSFLLTCSPLPIMTDVDGDAAQRP